jgi:hypothetical protein
MRRFLYGVAVGTLAILATATASPHAATMDRSPSSAVTRTAEAPIVVAHACAQWAYRCVQWSMWGGGVCLKYVKYCARPHVH